MLYYAAVFFLLAVVAAVFGFGGFAGAFSWAAQLFFIGFVVLTLLSAVVHVFRGRPA